MKQLLSSLKRGAVLACMIMGATSVAGAQVKIAPDPPQPASIAGHLAKAHQIAGNDPYLNHLVDDGFWCKSPAKGMNMLMTLYNQHGSIQPTQLFDNLYMFGTHYVVTMVLKTSDGLVVWDSLDNPQEVKTIFEPGMKHFGLDPKDIKLVILTHGHGDHFGGAKYMQDTYHVPIALSGPDWDFMLNTPAKPGAPTPPARDKVLTDGQVIKIGDATIRIVLTPGHTPATVSSILPVKDHGVTRMMAMWGGTAYPASDASFEDMAKSMEKFKQAAAKAGAQGLLNTHYFVYDIADRIAKRDPNGANPLVVGTPNVLKTVDIMHECLNAMRDWRAAAHKSS